MKKIISFLVLMTLLPAALIVGCDSKSSVPVTPPAATSTSTSIATGTATKTATATSTSTTGNTATNTATKTATRTATNTATRTATSTPSNTATNTATQTATGTIVPGQTPQATVDLGAAGVYGALSASGITNSGATTICGGLGSTTAPNPGGIQVNCGGPTDFGNGAATTAELALGTAYTDAQGRTGGAIITPGDIAGQTFYQGLYTCTGTLNITASDVYIDAQGDPNAVFIFQVNGGALNNLIVGPGRQVHLLNNAAADHVYWVVSGYCSLDTTVKMVGTIMAWSQITFNTGAELEGRALASTADITFLANTISFP